MDGHTVSSPPQNFCAGNGISEKFAVGGGGGDQIPQLPGQERFGVGIEISGNFCEGGTKFLTQKIKNTKHYKYFSERCVSSPLKRASHHDLIVSPLVYIAFETWLKFIYEVPCACVSISSSLCSFLPQKGDWDIVRCKGNGQGPFLPSK